MLGRRDGLPLGGVTHPLGGVTKVSPPLLLMAEDELLAPGLFLLMLGL